MILGSGFGPERTQCCEGAEPGLAVSVNGLPAAIDKSSPNYIHVRFPVRLPLGPATLLVTYQGRGSQLNVEISPYAPAILDTRLRVLQPGPGSPFANPDFVSPGQVVVLSASGLGPTEPEIPTAAEVPFFPPALTLLTPTLRIGSRTIPVLFSKLAAGPASGVYTVGFRVPEDLNTGVHRLILDAGGFRSNVMYLPVSLPGMQLTSEGFTFLARSGGEEPSAKRFLVLNATDKPISLRITPSTLSGGSQWLKIDTTSQTIKPGQTSESIFVSANPAGLAAGDYYGQIAVEGEPPTIRRYLSIVLNVLNIDVAPDADPTGLVFSAIAGGSNPEPDQFVLANPNVIPMPFNITSSLASVTVNPATGTIPRGGRQRIIVTARLNTLPAGVTRGTLNVRFPAGIAPATVSLLTVVAPRPSPATAVHTADANCVPKQLLPTATALGADFQVAAAWPVPLEVLVVTDCADPLLSGSVTATFSNGDPPVALSPISNGKWSGTWTPRQPASSTRITITAERSEPSLSGSAELKGSIDANPQVPVLQPGGVVSAASFSPILRNAPGEMISIFGSQLASSLLAASSLPLPTTLLTSSATLGGYKVPLLFAGPNQINGLLPYELQSGGNYQLVVRNGNRISTPEPLFIAAAGPAVFSTTGLGYGQGHIYAVVGSGAVLAAPASPARPGATIVLYCSGLGPVDQQLMNGAAVPSSPLSRVTTPVSVEIGGIQATVLFAGLTPGLAGLYQINAIVPENAPSGDAVPVLITSGGEITSPEVTMAIRR